MKILFYILLSLMQTYETSENRILADSIIENPEIIFDIGKDTNFVTSEFKEDEKTTLFQTYVDYISSNFTNIDYILEKDTVANWYGNSLSQFDILNYIAYYNNKNKKYLEFGFIIENNKWKLCYIVTNRPNDYPK